MTETAYPDNGNLFGTTGDTQYPTVVYTVNNELKMFSGLSFVITLKFALSARRYCDSGTRPILVFTDKYWRSFIFLDYWLPAQP